MSSFSYFMFVKVYSAESISVELFHIFILFKKFDTIFGIACFLVQLELQVLWGKSPPALAIYPPIILYNNKK